MPRRDGMPTNQEMLIDFTATSHEVYTNLYDLHMQYDLPPAYEGKPLRYISAHLIKRYFTEERPAQSVTAEGLKVSILDPADVDMIESDHLQMRHFPPDIFEYYRGIANSLAQVALTNGMSLRSLVPSNGAVGDYTAYYPNGSTRHVSTFTEKPVKQIIASAQYFAEEASAYITSGRSQLSSDEQLLYAHYNDEESVMTHHFDIKVTASLPLNGYESRAFLIAYRDKMIDLYQRRIASIERLNSTIGADSTLSEYLKQGAAESKAAAGRAQAILDQSNN